MFFHAMHRQVRDKSGFSWQKSDVIAGQAREI
jgi:hypothetical protein